jgi:hypothetical protein
MQGFGKFFDNCVNRKFIILQKFIWQLQFVHRKLLQPGKPVFPLGCALSLRSTKGNSSDHVAACGKGVLEEAVQSFDCAVRLRVISCSLPV